MTVAVIGPSAERYKGGIAQFTSRLSVELAKQGEVHFASWSTMYPRFLTSRNFTDSVSEQEVQSEEAHYTLSFMNPLSWLKSCREIAASGASKVVFTWIHPVHFPVYLVMALWLRLTTKARLVMLFHNVLPHESVPFQRQLTALCTKLMHAAIVHSESELRLLSDLHKRVVARRLFLPLFDLFGAAPEPEETVKSESETLRLLFFGNIRPYKGLDLLLDALVLLKERGHPFHLQVSGEAFDGDTEAVQREVEARGLSDSVTLDLRYLPNEDIPALFSKADLAVFPYRSATQSGSLVVAYAYEVPVIATRVGGLPEVVVDGESGYLCEPSSAGLFEALQRFIVEPIPATRVGEYARNNLSWERYAAELVAL